MDAFNMGGAGDDCETISTTKWQQTIPRCLNQAAAL